MGYETKRKTYICTQTINLKQGQAKFKTTKAM